MVFLLASIISSTLIYVTFRWAKKYSSNLTNLITLNYLAATFLGLVFFTPYRDLSIEDAKNWFPLAIVLGLLFTGLFFLIGNSSQKAGITVTTLANKLSLVFPVLFSLLFFDEKISAIKYMGLATAFVAIILTVYKKELNKTNLAMIVLPLLIFLGSGFADSIVKFVQSLKTTPDQIPVFSTSVFFVAFICALLISSAKKNLSLNLYPPTLLLGILLGLANFGSLYFLMHALNSNYLESSLIFTINNMSIVAFSAFLGNIIFREKLNKVNYIGLGMAFISLFFLM